MKTKGKIKLPFLLILILSALIVASCADTVDVKSCLDNDQYGFLNGLWHGFITPFSFIISLFKDDVAIYAINNNGNWYNLGFVLGAAIIFGGSGQARSGKK